MSTNDRPTDPLFANVRMLSAAAKTAAVTASEFGERAAATIGTVMRDAARRRAEAYGLTLEQYDAWYDGLTKREQMVEMHQALGFQPSPELLDASE